MTTEYDIPPNTKAERDALNRIHRDIALRLRKLEKSGDALASAEKKLIETGLTRINEVLAPAYQSIQDKAHLGALFSTTAEKEVTLPFVGQNDFLVAEVDRGVFAPAGYLALVGTSDPANVMLGTLASYDPATGLLVVNVTNSTDEAATETTWNVALAPPPQVGFSYSQAEIDQMFADLVASAGADLDTLGEAAARIEAIEAEATALASTVSDIGDGLASIPTPPEIISGAHLASNAVDAEHDIDIAAGQIYHAGSSTILPAMTKRLDAIWAAGGDAGGLDAGVLPTSGTLHIFALRKDADGTADVLASTSLGAPTVPAGWTLVTRLGSIITDASGNIVPFTQWGKDTLFDNKQVDRDSGAQANNQAVALSVPVDLIVFPTLEFLFQSNANGSSTADIFNGDGSGGIQVGATRQDLQRSNNWIYRGVRTNTAGEIIYHTGSENFDTQQIRTHGWHDPSIPRIN